MKVRIRRLLGVVTATFVVGIALFLWHISSPRIVARAVTPDGIEMCIVQKCNWSGELFTTSFYYRKPGGEWLWHYYDHQDGYWGGSRASLDTNARVAVFYRGRTPAVTFAWAAETYTLHRWNRTESDPGRMPTGWSPQLSVR